MAHGGDNTYSVRLPDSVTRVAFGDCQTVLGRRYGATVLAARTDGELLVSPEWDTQLPGGSVLHYVNRRRLTPERLTRAVRTGDQTFLWSLVWSAYELGKSDDIVTITFRTVLECATAGDESQTRSRCVTVDGFRGEVLLRMLLNTLNGEDSAGAIGTVDKHSIGFDEVIETEEHRRAMVRVHVPDDDRRSVLSRLGTVAPPSGSFTRIRGGQSTFPIELEGVDCGLDIDGGNTDTHRIGDLDS